MKYRFGVPPAPEGCGVIDHGPCFNCAVRALRRRTRWYLRQLLPLLYTTHYGTNMEPAPGEPGPFINVDYWRMWFGRVFAHRHYTWRLAPGEKL